MAIFDPNKAPKNSALPAQDALVIMTSFTRKTSKKGKDFLNARWEIIHGPAKKRSFFDNVHLDTSSDGSMRRLGMMCKAMGITEAWDLDDDRACNVMLRRPFKASISSTTSGEYNNNGIARFLTPSAAEQEILDQWVADDADRRALEGNGDGSGGGSDDFGDDAGRFGDNVPTATPDDDIPFLGCSMSSDRSSAYVSRLLK